MIFVTLVALSVAVSGQVQTTASGDAGQAKPPKEKKICRSEQSPGSRMTVHTCHTQTEWDQIDKNNAVDQHQMDQMSRQMSSH